MFVARRMLKARTLRRFLNKKTLREQDESSGFGIGSTIGITCGTIVGYFVLPGIVQNAFKNDDDDDDDDDDEKDGEKKEEKKPAPKPHDLTPFETLFNTLATVQKGDEHFMTFDKFLESLLFVVPQEGKLANVNVNKSPTIKLLLSFADVDGDGLISFPEYCLFMTMISCQESQLRIAFKMFDSDGSGFIDKQEFYDFIRVNAATHNTKILDSDLEKNALVRHFFGENQNKTISFDQFYAFVKSLKTEILRQEFFLYDPKQEGLISIDDFANIINESGNFTSLSLPKFKEHLERLQGKGFFKSTKDKVDFETFEAIHRLSQNLENISSAIKLYSATGKPLTKGIVLHALQQVAGLSLNPRTVDVIFGIFDKDQSGTLEFAEFESVLQALQQRENSVFHTVNFKL